MLHVTSPSDNMNTIGDNLFPLYKVGNDKCWHILVSYLVFGQSRIPSTSDYHILIPVQAASHWTTMPEKLLMTQ